MRKKRCLINRFDLGLVLYKWRPNNVHWGFYEIL